MKTLRFVFQSIVLVALVLALWPAAASGVAEASGASASKPLFTVTDLGTLGGSYSEGLSMNDRGQVIGDSTLPGEQTSDAFVWRNGVIKDLGRLDGPTSVAFGINERGQIVGVADTVLPEDSVGGSHGWVPVMWDSSGKIHPLGTLGGPRGGAYAIDDRGRIVGTADTSVYLQETQWYQQRGFIMQNGQKHAFSNPLGGLNTWAGGINSRGQVIGSVSLPGEQGAACVIWSGSLTTNPKFTNLGQMGGQWCNPYSISDQGLVSGFSTTPDGLQHAWKWQDGKATPLQPLPGDNQSYGLDGRLGLVVGCSFDGTDSLSRAVIWYGDKVVDLNTFIPADSGWWLGCANFINARGQITGSGLVNGQVHAYLLTPTRSLTQALAALPAATASNASHTFAVSNPAVVQRLLQHPLGRQLGRCPRG